MVKLTKWLLALGVVANLGLLFLTPSEAQARFGCTAGEQCACYFECEQCEEMFCDRDNEDDTCTRDDQC